MLQDAPDKMHVAKFTDDGAACVLEAMSCCVDCFVYVQLVFFLVQSNCCISFSYVFIFNIKHAGEQWGGWTFANIGRLPPGN